MVTHHDSVLKEQEVWAASEFLDLSQWTWRGCLSTDRNQLWQIEVIFADVVCILAVDT